MSGDFSSEQKRYLEGFVSGVAASRGAKVESQAKQGLSPTQGPDGIHFAAQDAAVRTGGKLTDQEKWKREQHPFDAYARLKEQASRDEFPKPPDNFRWRYNGLFYVAPAQNSYMCRLRIPNGILNHWQMSGVADIAETFGGGYAHVTTRANLQIREIAARHAVDVVESIQDIGLTTRGSGADNIRNVTGDATAGISTQELLDTRPYARQWHHHILNDRSLFGLPRKFNVAFDGGGSIPTLEDTNDIGFQAVDVSGGSSAEAGIWFRLTLGGITGQRDLARDTGIILRPGEAVKVADAIVRVFIVHGNRTNRNKARLKYLLDDWGFEKFLSEVELVLGWKMTRIDASLVKDRPVHNRSAHIGVHAQRQIGLFYLGVALPLGKITGPQIREIAAVAREFGDGDIRLSVWQNLLISGIPEAKIEQAKDRILWAGLRVEASAVRAGLVACTGSVGCRFAAADTKKNAQQIADWCDLRLDLDTAINIHLTGCHNSCAQHYIGDIGLIGTRVPVNDDGDTVDGYHVMVGGGFGVQGRIGRELLQNVRAENIPQTVEFLLRTYLEHRQSSSVSFHDFANAHSSEEIIDLMEGLET